MNDTELLQAWAQRRDEAAFTELVRRHLGLVQASARRQVGTSPLAEDVAQAVFLVLARKAGSLDSRVVLSGWLFRTTRFVAARAVRAEQRRSRNESLAAMQPTASDHAVLPEHWNEVEPHLDAALATLPAADRDALLLRYFEGRPFRAVGERLGIQEEAAKKRVCRAVEKLRTFLVGKGVVLSAVGLATVLGNLPGSAAPADLVRRIGISSTTDTASAAISALATGAEVDWLGARFRQLAPWAMAALLVVTAGVWSMRHGAAPASTVGFLARPAVALASTGGPPDLFALAAAPAARPGPSRILLSVHSVTDRRPLVTQIAAVSWTRQMPSEEREFATDSKGYVEIPVPSPDFQSLTLWLSAPGHVPVTLTWRRHEFVEPVLFHQCLLEPGQVLEGVVEDEDGGPVAGAQIAFNQDGDSGERWNIQYHWRLTTVTSDALGRFRSDQISSLRDGEIMHYTVSHPEFVSSDIELVGPVPMVTNPVVVLRRGVMVDGWVVDLDDRPIANAKVIELSGRVGPGKRSTSGGDGRFSLGPFSPGPVQIQAFAEGLQRTKAEVIAGTFTNELTMRLAWVDRSRRIGDPDNHLPKVLRVVGTVVDAETGEPLPRFCVRLRGGVPGLYGVLGDGHEGRFDWPLEVPVLEGGPMMIRFCLEVDADGYLAEISDSRRRMEGTETFAFRLHRGGDVRGRVVGPDGRPVTRASVVLLSHGSSVGVRTHDGRFVALPSMPQSSTDSGGEFSLRLRPNLESLVVVDDAGFAQVPIDRAGLKAIALQPWGCIEGVVLTAGQPAAGQEIRLEAWPAEQDSEMDRVLLGSSAVAKSDAEGRFRFERVVPGPVALCRFYRNTPRTSGAIGLGPCQRVDVVAGGTNQVVVSSRGRAVVGRFRLSEPVPAHDWRDNPPTLEEMDLAPGSKATRQRPESDVRFRRFSPRIEPDGSFRAEDVAGGSYVLRIRISVPPDDPEDRERQDFSSRPEIGDLELPVIVPDGDFNDPPLDLGTIVIPVTRP
jgi:RNA polymerase sigma factor (sigma-70 family)